ncbi:hypothetical protein Tco_1315721 [Tanacetum coccineum]
MALSNCLLRGVDDILWLLLAGLVCNVFDELAIVNLSSSAEHVTRFLKQFHNYQQQHRCLQEDRERWNRNLYGAVGLPGFRNHSFPDILTSHMSCRLIFPFGLALA